MRRPAQDGNVRAFARMGIGSIHFAQGRFEEASLLYEQVIEELEALGDANEPLARCRKNLAAALHRLGDNEAAETQLQTALRDVATGNADLLRASLHSALGTVLLEQGRAECLTHLNQALAILESTSGAERELSSLYHNVARASRSLEFAAQYLSKALTYQWEYSARNLSRLSPREKDVFLTESRELAEKALALAFAARERGEGSQLSDRLGLEAALSSKGILAESRRHDHSSAGQLRSASSGLGGLLEEKRSQYSSLDKQRMLALTSESVDSIQQRMIELSHEIDKLEQRRRQSQDLIEDDVLSIINPDDVLRTLRPRDVLLEFVEYRQLSGVEHYGVLLIDGERLTVESIPLGSKEQIDELVRLFVSDMRIAGGRPVKTAGQVSRSGQSVRQVVLDPVLQKLEERGRLEQVERLYVSASSALGDFPFEALPWGDGYLAQAFEVVYLASARDLVRFQRRRSPSARSPAVIVGDPQLMASEEVRARTLAGVANDDGAVSQPQRARWALDELDGADDLMSLTAQLFDELGLEVRRLTGTQAVEERVVELKAPLMMQFITHGAYLVDETEDDPMLRAVLLLAGGNTGENPGDNRYWVSKSTGEVSRAEDDLAADLDGDSVQVRVRDGLLSAYEVVGMDLQGTELVALTACETGMGMDAEGVSGFCQAFLIAGARSVIASKWKVPLDESLEQSKEFYQGWLGQGEPEARSARRYAAFRSAQLRALNRASTKRDFDEPDHPYWWAGFVYLGDPGDLPPIQESGS